MARTKPAQEIANDAVKRAGCLGLILYAPECPEPSIQVHDQVSPAAIEHACGHFSWTSGKSPSPRSWLYSLPGADHATGLPRLCSRRRLRNSAVPLSRNSQTIPVVQYAASCPGILIFSVQVPEPTLPAKNAFAVACEEDGAWSTKWIMRRTDLKISKLHIAAPVQKCFWLLIRLYEDRRRHRRSLANSVEVVIVRSKRSTEHNYPYLEYRGSSAAWPEFRRSRCQSAASRRWHQVAR